MSHILQSDTIDSGRTMPDMLPSVLSTESDASGNTFSLKYSSVTPQTWCDVSMPQQEDLERPGRGVRCSQACVEN